MRPFALTLALVLGSVLLGCQSTKETYLGHPLPALPLSSAAVFRSDYQIATDLLKEQRELMNAFGVRSLRLARSTWVVQVRVFRLDEDVTFPAGSFTLDVGGRKVAPLDPEIVAGLVSLPAGFEAEDPGMLEFPISASKLNELVQEAKAGNYNLLARFDTAMKCRIPVAPEIGDAQDFALVFPIPDDHLDAIVNLVIEPSVSGHRAHHVVQLATH